MHAKVYDRTGQPIICRSLGRTLDERLSRIHSILLQVDRSQLTVVYCNRRGLSRQHLSRCNTCRNWVYSLSWRWLDTVGLQPPKEICTWYCMGVDQRLQISDLHFDKFLDPRTVGCWKVRFKTEACLCSQFLTEAMQWIKEVEIVDSVDDFTSSSSVRGILMPDFAVLVARITSALNKIIHDSHVRESVWRNQSPRSRTVSFAEDRLLTWSISISGSAEPMILSKTMPTFSLLVFEMMIFRKFDSKCDGFYCLWRKSHLMTSWKVCTNQEYESEKLKTVFGIVWPGDSSEESRSWLSQIEDNGEEKYKEFSETVGNGNPTGSAPKETIAVSVTILISVVPNSVMQQNERKSSRSRSPRGKSASGRESRWSCKDYHEGTCTNSFFETDISRMLLNKTKSGCRFGKSVRLHIVVKGPKRMMTKVHWPCWRSCELLDRAGQPVVNCDTCHESNHGLVGCGSWDTRKLACVFQDVEPLGSSSISRKSSDIRNRSNVRNSRKLLSTSH